MYRLTAITTPSSLQILQVSRRTGIGITPPVIYERWDGSAAIDGKTSSSAIINVNNFDSKSAGSVILNVGGTTSEII